MKIGNVIRSAVIATLALVAVSPLSAGGHGRGRYDRGGRYDKHAYKYRGNAYRGGYYGRPAFYGYGPAYVAPRRCVRPVVVVDRPVYYEPYYYDRPVVVAAPPTFGINVVIR